MIVELTEPQRQALDSLRNDFLRVVDPRTKAVYVLVPASDFEDFREALDEEKTQRVIHTFALRNAAGRMNEEP